MQRLLVVLDLNGTLMHRLKDETKYILVKSMNPDIQFLGKIHGRPVVGRPGCHQFLKSLLEIADVAVWTSAQTKNAVPMIMLGFAGLLDPDLWQMKGSLDEAFSPEHAAEVRQCYINFKDREDFPKETGFKRLAFVWSQSQCDITGYSEGRHAGDKKPEFFKNLRKIWKAFPNKYDCFNTLIIDDSHKKIPSTLRNNLIEIPEYDIEKNPKQAHEDSVLLDLCKYLEKAVTAAPTDIRKYMQNKPFQCNLNS